MIGAKLQRAAHSAAIVPIVILSLMIAVAGFGYGYVSNNQQNQTLRTGLCGILEGIGYPPPSVAGPQTEYGKNQQIQFRVGARTLGCTDDPADGR